MRVRYLVQDLVEARMDRQAGYVMCMLLDIAVVVMGTRLF